MRIRNNVVIVGVLCAFLCVWAFWPSRGAPTLSSSSSQRFATANRPESGFADKLSQPIETEVLRGKDDRKLAFDERTSETPKMNELRKSKDASKTASLQDVRSKKDALKRAVKSPEKRWPDAAKMQRRGLDAKLIKQRVKENLQAKRGALIAKTTAAKLPLGLTLPEKLSDDPIYKIYMSLSTYFPTVISAQERETISKSGGEALYGEITMFGCEQLFKRVGLNAQSVFYDLGCGSGKSVLKAHTWGVRKSVGIELSPTRFAVATAALQSLRKSKHYDAARVVSFENADMFKVDISDASVIYMNMYSQEVAQKVSNRIKSLCKPGTMFASMYPVHEFDGWERLAPLSIRMSWSKEDGTPVYIYKLLKK